MVIKTFKNEEFLILAKVLVLEVLFKNNRHYTDVSIDIF